MSSAFNFTYQGPWEKAAWGLLILRGNGIGFGRDTERIFTFGSIDIVSVRRLTRKPPWDDDHPVMRPSGESEHQSNLSTFARLSRPRSTSLSV